MKRILIFSDTHGYINDCIRLIDTLSPTAIIHAGDIVRDCDDLMTLYPNIPIHCVCGNNDFSSRFPWDLTVTEEDKKIFITHGHTYRVKYETSYSTLLKKAKEAGADMCVFGHTHIPYNDIKDGIMIMNPGSVRFTRTYGVCEIENGKMRADIIKL